MSTIPTLQQNETTGDARQVLDTAASAMGFIPNLIAKMANAPALAEAYMAISGIFDKTSFDATERQVVLLSVSLENECTYCMAAHSTIAGMQGVDDGVVTALRDNRPLQDPKLQALSEFTRAVVKQRGWPSEAQTRAFLNAGYGQQQILEVVLGVGMKTLSNYTNHIADTELDDVFQAKAWATAA